MREILERLREYWESSDVVINPGASDAAIREFEERIGVALPDDLKEYFRAIGGMPGNMWDGEMIWFLPLAEVRSVYDEFKSHVPDMRIVLDMLSSADRYFIIADYLCGSHFYAVRLDGDNGVNNVILVYGWGFATIAPSFGAFIEQYLRDPESILFPPSL